MTLSYVHEPARVVSLSRVIPHVLRGPCIQLQFIAPLRTWPKEKQQTLHLDFDARHRRRIRTTADPGRISPRPAEPSQCRVEISTLDDGGGWRSTPPRSPSSKSDTKILMNLRGLLGILGNRHLPTGKFGTTRSSHSIVPTIP